MLLSSAENMRTADRRAAEESHIPSISLMEAASRAVAKAAEPYLSGGGTALVFCGSGNNGGDGVGAAVELKRAGFPVRAVLVGNRGHLTPDTAEMARRLAALGTPLEDYAPGTLDFTGASVVIDAIFGIGLNKPVEGAALSAIREINAGGAPVVAADIASGVEADTGRVLGEAVNAAVTVTFSMGKIGHYVEPGCVRRGRLKIVDIGIPREILRDAGIPVTAILDREVPLPRRNPLSHKGNYGKLLLLGGSVGYSGAPTLCARAAVRSGAGLVYLGVPAPIYEITAVKNDEAMPFPLTAEGGGLGLAGVSEALKRLPDCGVCAAGPGLGRNEGVKELVKSLLTRPAAMEKHLILDADALSALVGNLHWLQGRVLPAVLTPHEGEFLRIGGKLTGNRVADARSFARVHNCVLVLKGCRTLAAFPDGTVFISTHGNPGMAKGGSGDALTGILAALLGQFPREMKRAVSTAIQLHGLAGDLCRERLGEYAMTASDLIETLPEATKQLTED